MSKALSREDYARISVTTADEVQAMANRLADLARFMRSSPDYTGSVLELTRKVVTDLPVLAAECKTFAAATQARGVSALNEQIRAIEAQKAQLLQGKAVKVARKSRAKGKDEDLSHLPGLLDAAAEE